MSSTCNTAGCKNDRRSKLKHRQIIMPHVMKLSFHKPDTDDFSRWQARLDINRENYKVSSQTRICSNHFRSGYYKPGEVPSLHMRGYPDWAATTEYLQRQAAAINAGIVCQVLAHICQYLPPKSDIIQMIYKKISDAGIETNSTATTTNSNLNNLIESIMEVDHTVAAEILSTYFHSFPTSKVQEAVAIYKHGIWIECAVQLPKRSSAARCMSSDTISEENCDTDPVCLPYNMSLWHNYAQPHEGNQHQPIHYGEDVDPGSQTRHCDKKKKKPKVQCKRHKCIKEKNFLKQKNQILQGKVKQLYQQNRKLKQENFTYKNHEKQNHNTSQPYKKARRGILSLQDVKESDDTMKLHTGLPTVKHFNWVFESVQEAATKMEYWNGAGNEATNKKYMTDDKKKPGPTRTLTLEEELLLTLMTLKLNLLEQYLAFLFGVSDSLVSKVVSTWIPLLALELKPLLHWPDSDDIRECYPSCFEKWSNVIAIIDCFEIPTEKPSYTEANSQIFSSYKNRTTVKFLLACTPGGSISFISPPAGGNMSDVELVRQINLPAKFKPGDACMADKGFRMEGDFLQEGVRLIIPPFVRKGKQFTPANNEKNKTIAHARIHVERVIGRVRDYQILNSVIPLTRLDLIGPAAVACCALTNLKEPVVRPNH